MQPMSRWGCVALVAIGCGHAAPPPPPPPPPPRVAVDAGVRPDASVALDQDLPRLAERALQMYQDWQRALAEANGDCAVASAKVNALADAYADVIAANAKIVHAGRDRVLEMRAALQPHEAEFDAAAKAIVQSDTMAKCHSDADFAHAIDRIGGES